MAGVGHELVDEDGEVGGVRLFEAQLGLAEQAAVGQVVQGHGTNGRRSFERKQEHGHK